MFGDVPSSFSDTSTPVNSNPTVPATPKAPTPSTDTDPALTAPYSTNGDPHSSSRDACKSTNHTNKWVINLSKTPFTTEQLSLLQKGPNFAITPKYPHIDAYITAVEQASSKLLAQEADELRSDVNRLLKQQETQHNKQCNLNPTQCTALTQLKQDTSRVVLTADKGMAMVIMDQEDYIIKANTLLQDTSTYKLLKKNPISSLKNKLITILKDIKQTGALNSTKFKQLYPTSVVPPKCYGLP